MRVSPDLRGCPRQLSHFDGELRWLAEHFLRHFAQSYQGPLPRLTVEIQTALLRYAWPGNVCELAHVMGRAVFFGGTEMIHEDALAMNRDHLGEQPVPRPGARQSGPEIDFPSTNLVYDGRRADEASDEAFLVRRGAVHDSTGC
jgi:DNA-binding NtrC family response regulator